MSFIELLDVIIYQLVNNRTAILPLPTSDIAHLCNWYNYAFALLISMPRFKSITFYQNRSKIKLFLPNNIKNFRVLKAKFAPEHPASGDWEQI